MELLKMPSIEYLTGLSGK